MKTNLLRLFTLLFATVMYAQSGHIMQGVGAVNMSMGGAATGQPLDVSGAIQWNPASLSAFDDNVLKLDVGLFFSSPKLYSTVPEFDNTGTPTGNFFSGSTEDDRGTSVLPNIAYAWSNEDSKHTFGLSAFGISGFGVTFPESMTNPINMPQPNGFGHIESDYMLLQIGFTWAYELSDKFSIGIQPNFNYSALELAPSPLSSPDFTPPMGDPSDRGYPTTDKATATGFGGQIGLFYDSGTGFSAGASYKTNQSFSKFDFENTYLDGSEAPNVEFQMDYPAILSFGVGYSKGDVDLALDYRMVDYENTEGFDKTGWTPTGSVSGFGWENISILSAGIQYKGIDKLPLRLGYTYSGNPIPEEITFFNIPACAIIKNAFQLGLTFEASDNWTFDAVYHYGDSGDATEGKMLNPMFISADNPYGEFPGSSISYDMTTSMLMFGISYTFDKKEAVTQ